MPRHTLQVSALALMLAGSASLVMAQSTPPPTPTAPAIAHAMHAHHGDRHSSDMRRHDSHDRRGVIGDLRALDRLYTMSGRSKDMTAVYNDVLAKSQDPRVRDYTYHQLARLQARPANVDQAIATLRKGLDESLTNEAKMHADREKMRDAWKQHHDDTKPAVTQ